MGLLQPHPHARDLAHAPPALATLLRVTYAGAQSGNAYVHHRVLLHGGATATARPSVTGHPTAVGGAAWCRRAAAECVAQSHSALACARHCHSREGACARHRGAATAATIAGPHHEGTHQCGGAAPRAGRLRGVARRDGAPHGAAEAVREAGALRHGADLAALVAAVVAAAVAAAAVAAAAVAAAAAAAAAAAVVASAAAAAVAPAASHPGLGHHCLASPQEAPCRPHRRSQARQPCPRPPLSGLDRTILCGLCWQFTSRSWSRSVV